MTSTMININIAISLIRTHHYLFQDRGFDYGEIDRVSSCDFLINTPQILSDWSKHFLNAKHSSSLVRRGRTKI